MAGTTKQIIIADNDSLFAKALERYIREKREFYEITIVSDPESLFAAISELNPNLVIVDLSFPNTNAIDLYKKIVNAIPGAKIKTLVLTKRKELEDVFESMDVDSFIAKAVPFDVNYLLAEVDRIIHKKEKPVLLLMDTLSHPLTRDLRAALKGKGYKVIVIEGFAVFMTTVMEREPSYVVMEYEQKDVVSGKELIKKIRDILAQFSKTIWKADVKQHIIVYTKSDTKYKEESLSSGADVYVGKLEGLEKILDKIGESRRERERIMKDRELKRLMKSGGQKDGPRLSDFSSLGF